MKLKYNHNGETESIPLSSIKPEGKRLAVHHNDQNFYAPLVDAGDATASNLRTVFKGEMLAVSQMQMPEVTNILIEPPTVAVMQGQSATAIVSATANEAVAGLSYSIAHNPTWITISDECILIQPSDNDLGEAIVEVIAKDTGSNASMSAAFVAEALLRPIISSLSIAPPAVTVGQGQSATALIEAEANAAVTGLSYSLDGAPDWVTNDNDTIWVEPTTNDLGTSTVNVVAYDTNSSASAATNFVATAEMIPQIYGVMASPSTVAVEQGETTVVTISADYNAAVTSIEYSLTDAPSWMTISGNLITCAPTASDLGTVTVTVTARDTGSTVSASTQIVAEAQTVQPKISGITVLGNPTIKGSRVAVWQANTLLYPLTCTANSAVTSVKYSLDGAPAWMTVSLKSGVSSLRVVPTTTNSALGDTANVTLVAYDTGSTATATIPVPVTVTPKPSIGALTLSETDVTGYPEKAATITITPPSVNSGVTGIEYSLSAQPSWVTLSGNKIIAAPASGETGYQVVSVQAVDTGSTIVSARSKCSLRASVMPEITSLQAANLTVQYRDTPVTLRPTVRTSNNATYGITYSLKADRNWFSINSSTGQATIKVPNSEPISANSVTGSYTVTAINSARSSSVSVASTYKADMREVDRPSLTYTLNGDTYVSTPTITVDGASTNQTLLATATYKYSVPSGEMTLNAPPYYTSSLPVTVEPNATRTYFYFKGVFPKRSKSENGLLPYIIWISVPDGILYKTPTTRIAVILTSVTSAYYPSKTI